MYRHAVYLNCTGCGRNMSQHESELDQDGRDICLPCNNLRRVDLTLDRWRRDARADRWLHGAAGAMALTLLAMVPALFVATATIALTLLVAAAGVAFAAWIARVNQD